VGHLLTDALHSSPGFTAAVVAPGEVQDHYRNLVLLQTFGGRLA